MSTPTNIWPRMITRGPCKGMTFDSQRAYQKEYNRRTKDQNTPTSGLRGDFVVRVIDSYEVLRAAGITRREATIVLQRVVGA